MCNEHARRPLEISNGGLIETESRQHGPRDTCNQTCTMLVFHGGQRVASLWEALSSSQAANLVATFARRACDIRQAPIMEWSSKKTREKSTMMMDGKPI